MDYSDEEWKDVPGYNGRYQASTLGRVRTRRRRSILKPLFIMKPQPRGQGGYLGIGLCDPKSGKQRYHFVHLIILATFAGPKPTGAQGNHKNCDKHDNALANLEYVTPSENMRHALRNGRKKTTGRGSGKALSPEEVRKIRYLVVTVPQRELTNVQLAKRYNTSHETIRQIRLGRRWHCLDD